MRKNQKKELLSLIETLIELIDEISKFYSLNKFEVIYELLAQGQEFIVEICNYISRVTEKDFETKELLSNIYDDFFFITEDLSKNNFKKNYLKKIKSKLLIVKNTIIHEVKVDKLQVVFFPYKLSMWDSMETIWKAFATDDSCEVLVIPIPYFNLDSTESLKEPIYEVELYPKEVSVVDYRAYNIEKNKPDVVFYHNPYDDNNRVTSVHPAYYSYNLKKHTDFLVYVEYGLPFWQTIREFEVQPILSSFEYPDLIITNSEDYAKSLKYVFRNTKHLSHKVELDNLIVPLGSAKIDKVVKSNREDFTLPNDWIKKIGNKKVVLLNTGISGALRGRAVFLENLDKIIKYYSMRDDIVLWWRPHPLLKATFKSMISNLESEYDKIVDYFKNKDYGIYDETPDLHRAIAYSDALYSDESSLIVMYLATGKPFIIRFFYDECTNIIDDSSTDFSDFIDNGICAMEKFDGGNIFNENCSIYWGIFAHYDFIKWQVYDNYLDRFTDFILNENKYQNAEKYRQLKLEMFNKKISNGDGTAGEKIYEYIKKRRMGDTI